MPNEASRQCNTCGNWRPAKALCLGCLRCNEEGCCNCRVCPICKDKYQRDRGDECEKCPYCCQCRTEQNGIQMISTPWLRFHSSEKKLLKENRSRRFAAAEIEVAGITGNGKATMAAIRKWRAAIVSDGSLPQGGFEINTAPGNGDLLLQQIKEICDGLTKDDAWVDQSCGLHVHINARDFSYYDMRRLLLLYAKIEKSLYEVVPGNRKTSTYCKPCADLYIKGLDVARTPWATKAALVQNHYNRIGDINDAKSSKGGGERYHALNLQSWFFRGTCECRLHSGTTSFKKIANWLMLWINIHDQAMKMTERDIVRLPARWETLIGLAPNKEIAAWLERRREDMSKSIGRLSVDTEQRINESRMGRG